MSDNNLGSIDFEFFLSRAKLEIAIIYAPLISSLVGIVVYDRHDSFLYGICASLLCFAFLFMPFRDEYQRAERLYLAKHNLNHDDQ